MDRVANRTAYNRTAAALAELCGAVWAGSGVVRKLIMEEGHVGRAQPQAAQLRPWVGELSDADLLRGTGALLNPSQSDAVCASFRASFSAVQGPPGTGKTAAACLLLALASRNLGGSLGPLLATADSNAAADELLSSLLRLGVRAVRVGQPSRAEASSRALRDASLVAKAADHPDAAHIAHTRTRLGEQADVHTRTSRLAVGQRAHSQASIATAAAAPPSPPLPPPSAARSHAPSHRANGLRSGLGTQHADCGRRGSTTRATGSKHGCSPRVRSSTQSQA